MPELSQEFLDHLESSLAHKQGIRVITYELNETTETQLSTIIQRILEGNRRLDLIAPAYTCLKELVVNASKANFKGIYFTEQGYDLEDPEVYIQKSREFKVYLEKKGIAELADLARERDKQVAIQFKYNEIGCRVRVTNNTPLCKEDDRRIRNRLQLGSEYDDIAQFYLEQSDNLEGAGIGIALIQILLRGSGIDHKNFTIWTHGGETIAKLDFPFSGDKLPGTRIKPDDQQGWIG